MSVGALWRERTPRFLLLVISVTQMWHLGLARPSAPRGCCVSRAVVAAGMPAAARSMAAAVLAVRESGLSSLGPLRFLQRS